MSDLRMPSINQVTVAGRLTQDPEFRITEGGFARLTGRIAVNRAYRDRQNEWQDEASFFPIVVWGQLAERMADRLHKGTPVFVSGRLRSHSWRDDDENPHTIVEIQVRTLQSLERPTAVNGDAEDFDGVEDEEVGELELAA
jgi:single-strand DNA-binding protein